MILVLMWRRSMRVNQRDYRMILFLLTCASSVLGCQQPQTSINWLKSIAALRCCVQERYRLHSSRDGNKEIQQPLVLKLNPHESKSQSFSCFRLDGDTLIVLSAQTKHNERITFASCYSAGSCEKQWDQVQQFFQDRGNTFK